MKKTLYGLTFVLITGTIFLITSSSSSFAGTPFNVNISGDSRGVQGFDVSIGDYYRVPEREVVVVHERGIPEDELPVVFFLSQRAHVKPEIIVDMRLRGMSWMDVTLHYGLSPEIYYVPVGKGRGGPPYGNAYGYYKHHKKHEWKHMRFRDEDIVNQVNTKFISEHHRYAPEKVMRYRSEGKHFADIDQDIRHEKRGKQGKPGKSGKQDGKADGKESQGKGKNKEWKDEKHHGNGKGNGKGHD